MSKVLLRESTIWQLPKLNEEGVWWNHSNEKLCVHFLSNQMIQLPSRFQESCLTLIQFISVVWLSCVHSKERSHSFVQQPRLFVRVGDTMASPFTLRSFAFWNYSPFVKLMNFGVVDEERGWKYFELFRDFTLMTLQRGLSSSVFSQQSSTVNEIWWRFQFETTCWLQQL